MPNLPSLVSAHLHLKPWNETTYPLLQNLLSDPITMKFWPDPYDEAGSRRWFHRALANYPNRVGRMAVYLRENDLFLGDAGLNPFQYGDEEGLDIGWIIDHFQQRKGYGFEAGRLLMKYAREELAAPLIVANMPDDHPGSWRIAEKLGMIYDKTEPNPYNRNILTRWYVSRS